MQELIKLSARRAVAALAQGEITPGDLLAASEARIAECDPQINALPTLCFERARQKAEALAKGKPPEAAAWFLHGLPVAIKDLQEVAGVRTTFGSPIFADHVPQGSEIAVQRLEANGALVVAKSNTPEFGAGGNTFNEVFGATRNPWNTALTCGGSSGGSAAALAAGMVWLATGSDLAGSLRTPASFCSVVGFRPSPGRVAFGPDLLPWQSLAVTGPMARTVGDLALMLDAMAGYDPRDPRSLARPAASFLSAASEPSPPKRVAFSPDLGLGPVTAEVEQICASAARRLEDLGAVVEEAFPDLSDAPEIFGPLRAMKYVAGLGEHLERHREKLKPEVVWNIEEGMALDITRFVEAEKARGALYQRAVEFFATYDLLLCPAVVCPPFAVEQRFLSELEGVAFESYYDWLNLAYGITLTASPALSLPAGFTADGRPVGLQIVGPPRGDAAVLAAAALLEQVLDIVGLTPLDPQGP